MIRHLWNRPVVRMALMLTLLAALAPLSTSAAGEATRAPATFTSTQTEILDPGAEWLDAPGIYHARGVVELDEISGDIAGTGTITLNFDFFPPGACTEDSCPGYTEVWGTVDIQGEGGYWTGRFMQSLSDVPEDEYAFSAIALYGHGGYAGMSFYGSFTTSAEAPVTLEGTLTTMALPLETLAVDVTVCFGDVDAVGNYLGSGAIDRFGHAEASFFGSGTVWTHTYNLFGIVELSNAMGSVTLGFVSGAQDTGFVSHGFGNFVITEGTGAYAELYGHGRVVGAAAELPQCASGFGARLSLIGEAHYN